MLERLRIPHYRKGDNMLGADNHAGKTQYENPQRLYAGHPQG